MQSSTGTRGLLVVFEGIDGSGKTTIAEALANALEAAGHRVVRTREPTNGPYGRRIRELAATGRNAVGPEMEFELFHRDRIEHVNAVVRPALAAEAIVLQDRSYFSSVAYQGDRGLDRTRLLDMSEAVAPKPDLLFVVDVPAEVAVERILASRTEAPDDFERRESLERIRAVFAAFPGAIVVDGTEPRDRILALVLGHVLGALGR